MRDTPGMAQGVNDGKRAALQKAEKRKVLLRDRGRDGLQIGMPCLDRESGDMPARQAAAARMVAHEAVADRESLKPGPPHRAFEIASTWLSQCAARRITPPGRRQQ